MIYHNRIDHFDHELLSESFECSIWNLTGREKGAAAITCWQSEIHLKGLMYEVYQFMAGNVNATLWLRHPAAFGKPLRCETTGSNTTAHHPKHIYDLDLVPTIPVTRTEQQRTQNKPPVHPFHVWLFLGCSVDPKVHMCCLLMKVSHVVGMFQKDLGLDDELVTGLPAPDVHEPNTVWCDTNWISLFWMVNWEINL